MDALSNDTPLFVPGISYTKVGECPAESERRHGAPPNSSRSRELMPLYRNIPPNQSPTRAPRSVKIFTRLRQGPITGRAVAQRIYMPRRRLVAESTRDWGWRIHARALKSLPACCVVSLPTSIPSGSLFQQPSSFKVMSPACASGQTFSGNFNVAPPLRHCSLLDGLETPPRT
jgi:hypothetical protein